VPSSAKPASLEKRQSRDVAAVEALLSDDLPTSLSRAATVRWMGHPPGGEPRLTVGSHSLTPAPTLDVDRAVPNPMATPPGELLAGGFGIIFAKVLADQLVRDQAQATELVVQVAFVLSQTGPDLDPVLSEIRCHLEARVDGIDHARLAQVGERAMLRSIDGLAMRAEAISVSLTVSLVGDPSKRPAHGLPSTSVTATAPADSGALPGPGIANGRVARSGVGAFSKFEVRTVPD
jgi:hypothetical protein